MDFGGRDVGLGVLLEESQIYQKRRVFKEVVLEACNMRVRGLIFILRKLCMCLLIFKILQHFLIIFFSNKTF